MSDDASARAAQEIDFCAHVLAKGGQSVLSETLRGHEALTSWTHYPEGDVFDPESGAQWYYHCHAPDPESAAPQAEHGHFHCFVRPMGQSGPVHHLCAVGVDASGALLRLFTVNQWVVGDDWLNAEPTIALLDRFDVHMPQPSYLVNRWLTAVLAANHSTVAELIRKRDAAIAAHQPTEPGIEPKQSQALEVTAEHRFV